MRKLRTCLSSASTARRSSDAAFRGRLGFFAGFFRGVDFRTPALLRFVAFARLRVGFIDRRFYCGSTASGKRNSIQRRLARWAGAPTLVHPDPVVGMAADHRLEHAVEAASVLDRIPLATLAAHGLDARQDHDLVSW
jgi:hypothetical protein